MARPGLIVSSSRPTAFEKTTYTPFSQARAGSQRISQARPLSPSNSRRSASGSSCRRSHRAGSIGPRPGMEEGVPPVT